jgi:hypothetical protein
MLQAEPNCVKYFTLPVVGPQAVKHRPDLTTGRRAGEEFPPVRAETIHRWIAESSQQQAPKMRLRYVADSKVTACKEP